MKTAKPQDISTLPKKRVALKSANSGLSDIKGKMICVITQLSNAIKHKCPT